MQTLSLSQKRLIIWDLDACLYPGGDLQHPDHSRSFEEACKSAARRYCHDLSESRIKEYLKAGSTHFGMDAFGFRDVATGYEYSSEALVRAIHEEACKLTFEGIKDRIHEILPICQDTIALFKETAPHVTHVCLTHSCKKVWAPAVLEHLGLSPYFTKVFDISDIDYRLKNKEPYAVQYVMETIGYAPDQVVFLEDSPKNLHVAKAAFPEITTILIHNGKKPDIQPHYVDGLAHRPPEFLRALHAAVVRAPQESQRMTISMSGP